jgi:hypothetical protein
MAMKDMDMNKMDMDIETDDGQYWSGDAYPNWLSHQLHN